MTLNGRLLHLEAASHERAVAAFMAALDAMSGDELLDWLLPLTEKRHYERTPAERAAWERFEALGGATAYCQAIGVPSMDAPSTAHTDARAVELNSRVPDSIRERFWRAHQARQAA